MPEGSAIEMNAPSGYYGVGLYDVGADIEVTGEYQFEGGTCYFADGTSETIPAQSSQPYTIPENAAAIFVIITR